MENFINIMPLVSTSWYLIIKSFILERHIYLIDIWVLVLS